MSRNTGLRVLVADDEQSLQDVLSEVLTDDGYSVTAVDSAERALEVFGADPFPLVITDIRMAGMNGIELLERVKTRNSETQVIIMTSHASLETAITALRAGAYDYLIKPFEDLELISAVVNRAVEKIRLNLENKILVEKLRRNNEELENLNTVLRDLAIRDGLTGLYNHRYFQEAMAIELARSRRHNRSFSLVFFDVDHFKHYNDRHGHPRGDQLLCGLGEILKSRTRQSDIAARYGGEEFVLILPETSKEGAAGVAENIRREVAAYPIAGRETQPGGAVTVSIGVATFPEDGTEGHIVIQQADRALYQAKNSGRNKVRLARH